MSASLDTNPYEKIFAEIYLKSHQKRISIKKSTLILIIIFIVVIIPVIIHFLYQIPAPCSSFVAIIPADALLSYEGTIIGSFFLLLTVILTIKNTKKDAKIDKILNAMSEFIEAISTEGDISLIDEKPYNEQAVAFFKCYSYIHEKLSILNLLLEPVEYDYFFDMIKDYIKKMRERGSLMWEIKEFVANNQTFLSPYQTAISKAKEDSFSHILVEMREVSVDAFSKILEGNDDVLG